MVLAVVVCDIKLLAEVTAGVPMMVVGNEPVETGAVVAGAVVAVVVEVVVVLELPDDGKTEPTEVLTIAGSWIRLDGNWLACFWAGYGSHTCKSSMSEPRKMMYSNTSSLGMTGRSVGRSSVPNERTLAKATVDSLVSIVYKIPS